MTSTSSAPAVTRPIEATVPTVVGRTATSAALPGIDLARLAVLVERPDPASVVLREYRDTLR